MTAANEITKGSEDILVAVLDTGVDYFHQDLKNNIFNNQKEIPSNGIDDDNNGHIDDYYGFNFFSNIGSGMDDNVMAPIVQDLSWPTVHLRELPQK